VTKPTEEILLNDRKELDTRSIAYHMREIIKLVGEDPNREGLRKTPERFEKALKYLTSRYHLNLDHVLNGATFSVAYDEMVIVKDIEFFSLCEHHLLPFFGKAHVAYLPDKRVLGLSKIARSGQHVCAPPADSERMTSQIAHSIEENRSSGCRRDYRSPHLCMQMRGVEKAAWPGGHQPHAWCLPSQQADARRVSRARAPKNSSFRSADSSAGLATEEISSSGSLLLCRAGTRTGRGAAGAVVAPALRLSCFRRIVEKPSGNRNWRRL